jgi:hypothetical protein
MLTIEIKVNGNLIALARVQNVTNLTPRSDYVVRAKESREYNLGIPAKEKDFVIHDHDRAQSVWELVERVATAMNDE